MLGMNRKGIPLKETIGDGFSWGHSSFASFLYVSFFHATKAFRWFPSADGLRGVQPTKLSVCIWFLMMFMSLYQSAPVNE